MADPVKVLAKEIYSFCRKLSDGNIRKMYRRAGGDGQERTFPQLKPGRPAEHFRKLFLWALVNEHDARDLA